MNRYNDIMRKLFGKPVGYASGKAPIRLTEEDLLAAEQRLGASLPEDYREFIRDFGEYLVPFAAFGIIDPEGVEMDVSIEIFNAILPASAVNPASDDVIENYKSICDSYEQWPQNCLPIAMDAGSSGVGLAFKGEDIGSVYYMLDQVDPCLVGKSFDEFMHKLRNYRDDPMARARTEEFWKEYLDEE